MPHIPEPAYKLPIEEQPVKKDIPAYHQKICAIVRSQAVKIVSGKTTDFDEEMKDMVESIWQDGYSKGLKDMDRMHKKIDVMIGKAIKI